MTGLVAFLNARLDEDEAAANRAWDEKARLTFADIPRMRARDWDPDDIAMLGPSGPARAISEHIARHDPGRVLREVEAGRRILARYADCLARMEDDDYPARVARDQAREYEDFVLPNLATAWSDHTGYDDE